VVHLDELHEKYKAQGFTVLAVTNEARSAVDAFIAKTSAKHPIVVESSDSAESFQITGYPSAFLIGADGRIAVAGHPSAADIEEALTKARVLPEAPKKLEPVRTAIEKSKFADATAKVTKALLDPSLTPEEKDVGEKLRDWIDWYVKGTLDGAKAMCEKGDFYEASVAYEDAAKELKGLPAAAEATASLKALLAVPKQKEEVTAGERLAKAKVKAKEEDDPKKAILLFKPIASKYEDTKAGAKAKEIIEALEKQEKADK
jgi:hypothetical protein